jgi:predicted Rossmann fold flavoprotein
VQDFDVAVVGAGAAGLMAAIFAGRGGARVVALDGAKRIGAKILIAGGGRCNVTHDVVTPDDFNGNRNAIAKVLRTLTVDETVRFFEEQGVKLKREETGKLFPVSDRAQSVLDALLDAARDAGVELRTNVRVDRIDPGFVLGEIRAPRVILATGGRSVPKTGSDGSGYALAQGLGHTVTDVFPALVPLLLDAKHWLTELSGTSCVAELIVRSSSGRVLERHRGSMLFTHFGLSGPVVLDISRHLIAARRDDPGASLIANLLPGETFESLESAMLDAAASATVTSLLRGRLPERLLDRIVFGGPASAGRGERSRPAEAGPPRVRALTRDERRRVIRDLVELPLPVVRDRGFDYAEVTAGGVPLSEIEIATMKSRTCEGLYLCGEILDVDGRIGGYNFQWAWATGRLAGIAAASK